MHEGLQVDLIGAGSRPEVRAEEGLVQLATLACDWCRLSREEARVAMSESAFAQVARKSTGKADGDALLEKALAAIYDADFDGHADTAGERRLVEPPRDLIGHWLALPCTRIQSWTNQLSPCSVTAWSTRTRYYRPFVGLSRKLASSGLWRRRR